MKLLIDYTMILQPGEFNFQRPAYDVDIQIEQMNLNIDPKQFSDLLDFIKFQNYSILYGRMISRSADSIQASLDTRRSLPRISSDTITTSIGCDRIDTGTETTNGSETDTCLLCFRTALLVFEQVLEVKLDVFNLAYIQHSVEMEMKSMQSESKKNDVQSSVKRWNIWRKAKHSSHTGS